MPWEDGLGDFEKQLAAEKADRQEKDRPKDGRRKHHKHHHHHRSHKDHDDEQDGHRSKRRRHDDDGDRGSREDHRSHRHHRRRSSDKEMATHETPTSRPDIRELKRDSWMQAPSTDIEHVQRKRKQASPPKQGLGQDFEMKIHKKELNHHLRDLKDGKELDELENEDAQHEVIYTFGDRGSSWRMTKLKSVYRQAEEKGQSIEEAAIERFGSLRDFDNAREEEIELDRRDTYGKDYVGKEKPSGELFQERKLDSGVQRSDKKGNHESDDEFDTILDNVAVPAPAAPGNNLPQTTAGETTQRQPAPDQTAINKLKAQLMKAELRKDPKAAELRAQYEALVSSAASQSADPTVVQLSAMGSRMLTGTRNEVQSVSDRRGRERGNVKENEDMSIEDMVAEERRTRNQGGGGEAARYAERIAKDGKFDNDLDYQDENATKLATRVHKSDMNLRNMAIGEYQKMNRILDNCPLCHHENASDSLPTAPIVSLATRTYLTLPTKPELAPYTAMIVPTQHHTNLLHCDDDEWEEIRNFMKSLTRFYHSRDTDVLFYENAAFPSRHPHAAMVAVPLPRSVGETSPAFFKEAFLTTESEWSQHKKIIDTEAKARNGDGRSAFRRALAKEMPYFHVWFSLDGGLGHVVEDPDRWPRGDLFAREVVGGMLGMETEVVKKTGRWVRGGDRDRVEAFRKRWRKYDWTRVLIEGGA